MSTESEKRLHRCCFTGHRPEKLAEDKKKIIKALERAIISAINEGYTTFISGMSRGTDIWAAEIVLKLRRKYSIKLICAIPFKNFNGNWDVFWKIHYNKILSKADLIKYICESYRPDCFQVRNEWMVNHSSQVIAIYNGTPGGTKNTIRYATKNRVKVINILEE